ncbi:MAG: GNAT family N-acetyltransferase [Anaerolineales bacterium]|nr:GNAT family N-acetyltransferase [Anaerolineales bacterium]
MEIELLPVTRKDVARIISWLQDEEIIDNWFGRYSYGDPAHLGYHPEKILDSSENEWERIFDNPEHRILSVYTKQGDHIGELHLAIDGGLGDGHLSILIGRKDLWHKGYGTASMKAGLHKSFNEWELYRVWVDVPEFNKPARSMCEHLGFVHEGTLRKSRPHEGSRFNSVIMGMLSNEYQELLKSDRHERYHKL